MVFISGYLTFKLKMRYISHIATTCYTHTDHRPQDLLVREGKSDGSPGLMTLQESAVVRGGTAWAGGRPVSPARPY